MILASLHDRNRAETSLQGVDTPEKVALATPIAFRERHQLQGRRLRGQIVVADDGANTSVRKVKRDRETQDQEHRRRPKDRDARIACDLKNGESSFAKK